jgi:lipopolysaccharide transport protein LptA
MKYPAVNPDLRQLVAAAAFCALFALSAAAQEEAGSHEYRADGETTIETRNGVRVITLRDNVFVRQNAVELTGNVAVLEYDLDNQLQKVTLTGTPARFSQQAADSADAVSGYSDTINYFAGTQAAVEFVGTASFTQPGTSLLCAQIRHTIETGATSGQACSGSLSPQTN